MKAYTDLIQHILDKGTLKENRTGTSTLSTFGYFYRHDLRTGFPLLTTKKMSWQSVVLENLWFLSGDTHIGFLRHYGIKFWEPWADTEGFVPSAYGNFHRHFPVHRTVGIETIASFNDQIAWAIKELRNNPLSRRIVISAWAPGNAQTSALPPCHAMFALNTQADAQGELCLNLALFQRSADAGVGVPFNLAGYSFLLHLFAHLTNLKVGEFAHTLVDAHIYVNHIDGLKEQITREPLPLPKLCISSDIKELSDIEDIIASRPALSDILDIFKLEHYQAHPAIPFVVAV